MAPHSDKLKLLRVVVREDFSRSRCETFIRDLTAVRLLVHRLGGLGRLMYHQNS